MKMVNLGLCTVCNQGHEFRNSIITGIVTGVIAALNKLPEGNIPTVTDAWLAVRLGVVVTLTFYSLNKVFSNNKKEVKPNE
jgi:hypothetical protein